MKKNKKGITPEKFISWAIGERKRCTRMGQARIDAKIAVLHRQGRISEELFREYKAAIPMQ